MKSTFTLKRIFAPGIFAWSLLLFCFFSINVKAQTYINGNLGTGTTALDGTPAPAGFQWHELQNDAGVTTVANSSLGWACTGTFTVADDFTVPAGSPWAVSQMTFYGIQPVAAPVTAVNVQIYDGDPSLPGSTVVYGDLTTNRLASTAPANIYGAFNSLIPPSTPNTNYPIIIINANVSTVLAPGTYWVEWKYTSGSATFTPSSQVVGVRTVAGYNSMQSNAGLWGPLLDSGVDPDGNDAAMDVAVDLPFKVVYSTGVCSGTPDPGATSSTATTACPGTSFNLSVANSIPGSGVTYQWQSSPDGTTWTDIPGAIFATYTATLTADTYYRLEVTCSGNIGTSTPVQVLLTPASGCYCIPDPTDCTDGDIITNVTLDVLNNTSDCGNNGYTDYTTDASVSVPDIVQGSPTAISVAAGGGIYDEFVAAWIDYDHSGTFDASEFTAIGETTGGTLNATINVAANAILGPTRMRVRVRFFTALTGADACTGYVFGETEDYAVNIVPCVPATFTSQPTDATTTCPGTATFTAAASVGTALTFQWQQQVDASAPWVNLANGPGVSGANTTTLTLSNVPSSLNGSKYRLVINGACTGTDFTSAATLTVNPLVIAVTPSSYSTCEPITTPVQLSITSVFGSAVTNTVTYPSGALNLAIPDNDIAGITSTITVPTPPAGAVLTGASVNLNITHTFDGDLVIALKAPNDNILNLDLYLTGSFGDVTTGFVNTLISSTGTAALSTGTDPYTGIFKPDAYVTAPAGAPYPNTGPTSLGDANVTAFSDLYSVPDGDWTLGIFDGGAIDVGTLDSFDLNLTYTTGVFQPYTGVWSPAAGLFSDPAGTIPYVAGTQASTVYAAPTATTFYTVTVTDGTCPSDPVVIPVRILNADPVVTLGVTPYTSLYPGLVTVATATITPAATTGTTYQWFSNGVAIPGATSPTYQANVDAIGELSVQVSDTTFCSGTVSASTTLKDSLTSTLFIYPNPNSGVFQVRYDNGVNDILGSTRTLSAYDSKGARIYNKSYKISSIYQRMDVDLGRQPKGIYIIELTDGSGKRLQAERVVIR